MVQWQPYALLPLLSLLIAVILGVYAARHRSVTPAADALILMTVGCGLWAAEDAIGGFLTSHAARESLLLLRFPALNIATVGFFWFCRVLVDNDATLSRRVGGLLAIEPVLITLAAATNHWHRGLIASTELVGQPSMLRYQGGPLFVVQSVYSTVLMMVVFAGVLRAMRTASELQRRQLGTIVVAAVFPILGAIATNLQSNRGGGGDYAVLGFGVSGALAGWAAFRQGLLRVVPIARGLVLDRVGDAVLVLDRHGRVLDLNQAASRLIAAVRPDHPTDPADLTGRPARGLLTDDTSVPWPADGVHTTETSGGRIDLDIRTTDLLDRRGTLMGHVVVARDVTESNDQKRALRAALSERDELAVALRHQAFHDALTGLANRALFTERLTDEYARSRRAGIGTAAMFIDLDDFKVVNDRLGHHAGDLLLQQAAARMTANLRQADTVARLGGDEFAVILTLPRVESVRLAATRLIEALQTPFDIQGETVTVGASIGVAVDHGATGEPDQLLRDADAAMYDAKRSGKGAVVVIERGGVERAPA